MHNQVPSILCSVVDIALELDMEIYHVCSGSCQNNWMCRGSGKVVGTRYLKCEGVKGMYTRHGSKKITVGLVICISIKNIFFENINLRVSYY